MWIPTLEYWYLFPTGLAVATVAMSSGVSGSNFWIPIYLLAMRLEPRLAFWASLATLCFGFGSGVVQNARAGTLDAATIRRHLVIAVPAAAIGALLSRWLPVRWLLAALGLFLLGYAGRLAVERRLAHRPATAVGSTVAVVLACSLVALAVRVDAELVDALQADWRELASMLVFAGPGAALGGQLGPRLARRLTRPVLRLYLAAVLGVVGLLVLSRAIS